MQSFVVFLSGEIFQTAALADALAGRRAIAADGGLAHAETLGLVPELIVGDFDSAAPQLLDRYRNVERADLPRDKGETDGDSAIGHAVAMGASDILVVGALGGPRTDHLFSNLVLLTAYAERGHRIAMFDGREWVFPLLPGQLFKRDISAGAQLSICRFSDVRGLSIRGVKWPLHDVTLPFGSVLTQSNEALGPVEIELAAGRALVVIGETPTA